jgi:hypothetical protein
MKQIITKEAWTSDLTLATWNVWTILIPGKMQEISKEMKERMTSFDLDG